MIIATADYKTMNLIRNVIYLNVSRKELYIFENNKLIDQIDIVFHRKKIVGFITRKL